MHPCDHRSGVKMCKVTGVRRACVTLAPGKGEYAQQPPGEPAPSEPRLFHCTNAYGRFQVHIFEDVLDLIPPQATA